MYNPTNVQDYINSLEEACGIPAYIISDDASINDLLNYMGSNLIGMYAARSALTTFGITVKNGVRTAVVTDDENPKCIQLTNSRNSAQLVDYTDTLPVVIGYITATDVNNFTVNINGFVYTVTNGSITPRCGVLSA